MDDHAVLHMVTVLLSQQQFKTSNTYRLVSPPLPGRSPPPVGSGKVKGHPAAAGPALPGTGGHWGLQELP